MKDMIQRIGKIKVLNDVTFELKETITFPRNKRHAEIIRENHSEYETDFGKFSDTEIGLLINSALRDAQADIKSLGEEDILNNIELLDVTEKNKNRKVENIGNVINLKDYSNVVDVVDEDSPFLKVKLGKRGDAVIKKSTYCWLLEDGRVSTDRIRRFYTNTKIKKQNLVKKRKDAEQVLSEEETEDETEVVYNDSADLEEFSAVSDDEERNLVNTEVEISKIIEDEEILLQLRERNAETHPIFQTRTEEGCFEALINRHLLKDDEKFREYFRLNIAQFNYILVCLVKEDLKKDSSPRYPYPISPDEELALTLR
ncbi:hypothetical protein FQR65_LT15952 [Abscondita terminalis]|nr:hypothetical protein FQR65_LT15952 [Abscondita terminalis]